MISIATQSEKPYTRLIHVARKVLDEDRVLTRNEKQDFAEAICDVIPPYDACYTMGNPNDQWDSIYEDASDRSDEDIVIVYLHTVGCGTLEEYIEDYGLPVPSRDDMVECIVDAIDLEEYINDYVDDYVDILFEQLQYNCTDEDIVELFAVYVKSEVYDD